MPTNQNLSPGVSLSDAHSRLSGVASRLYLLTQVCLDVFLSATEYQQALPFLSLLFSLTSDVEAVLDMLRGGQTL